jgi:hypothetical protein
MTFHDSTKKNCFQNVKIKLNLRPWMTLNSSEVIFQALKPLQPHTPHQSPQSHWPHWPQQPLQSYFFKELPKTDGWIIPCTKMTNTAPFLWNGSSKIQIFTDI